VAFGEIVREAAPVLPLLCELPPEQRARGDFDSFEYRECFTVLTLLGRRLALLDLTPSGAFQVVQLLLRAVDESDGASAGGFAERAIGAAFEGFVIGREERVDQTWQARSAKTIAPLQVADRVLALTVTGVHEPAVLSEHVDALGRKMLDADADVAIVDLSQLGEPSSERAAAIFSADEMARMLGAVCIFAGIEPHWRAQAESARIALDTMEIVPSFAAAILHAEELRKRRVEPGTRRWRSLLGQLGRQRRGSGRK
jgi:hypothetical protein